MLSNWHTLGINNIVEKLQSNIEKGLTDKEAKKREERVGQNRLVRVQVTSVWQMLLDQFKDFMVLVLIAATIISGLLGEYADALTILVIVILNAVLGLVQEFKAEKSLEALKEMTSPEAKVIRRGVKKKIPTVDLVPGDIVILDAGVRVPADLRIIEAMNLAIEESALTGESTPTAKNPSVLEDQRLSPGDMGNMAFLGTLVTRGRGKGIVVATGMATEMGRIAGMIQEVEPEQTPLQKRLAQLGKGLVAFCLLVCTVVVVLGVIRGASWQHMFMAGVSLAVAAVPEGLPAIVTISLALGVQRMIKRNAIIRKLQAVETLGCATIICSDKTGTLTENKMTVRKVLVGESIAEVTGEGYSIKGDILFKGRTNQKDVRLFAKVAALCNNATLARGGISIGGFFRSIPRNIRAGMWEITGDPTEGALLVMSAKAGAWREQIEGTQKRIWEIPFDSNRKRMTVIYRKKSGDTTAYIKGAPGVILDLCTHRLLNGRVVPLTVKGRERLLDLNSRFAGEALRVLAMAYRELPSGGDQDYDKENVEENLVFIGLAGMQDPPRKSAIKAVEICKLAGIKVVMITGDHQQTACAVARELGIMSDGGEVITGGELDLMDEEGFEEVCEDVAVYARVSPQHKLRIVKALKKCGHVVAMTGDGVNDAPAVKESDIGISMGISGTDVTKEASSIILVDDNFKTIVAAVEEGRGIYDNIRKFIRYLLACNVGEVLVMFLAVLLGFPLPLLPIQILWMNLVTDGLPAMALGVDPTDKDIMQRKPRDSSESIFAHGMGKNILLTGFVISLGTLMVFAMCYFAGYEIQRAQTMAFSTLVFTQLLYVFNCRSDHPISVQEMLFSNAYLLLAVSASVVLQLAVTYVPFLQLVFHTVPLTAGEWVIILTVATTSAFLGNLVKVLQQKIGKRVIYAKH
ncbi:MAG TPA: calcium-translocating P-type ATPase, SERCA-type [Clostridia bacterium]|nr:calcium-translocating P-type ATPase, SERCA-type [Clostridia bacterium]